MKMLYIVRHAKSSWNNLDLPDIERPLNDRGVNDAPVMGNRLKKRGILPDLILCSTAIRSMETGRAIATAVGYPSDTIKVEKLIYHASEDQLLKVVRANTDHERIMIVGHNPGLSQFANRLLDEALDTIPTCGVVVAKLNIESWKEAAWGCGELEFFDSPKNQD